MDSFFTVTRNLNNYDTPELGPFHLLCRFIRMPREATHQPDGLMFLGCEVEEGGPLLPPRCSAPFPLTWPGGAAADGHTTPMVCVSCSCLSREAHLQWLTETVLLHALCRGHLLPLLRSCGWRLCSRSYFLKNDVFWNLNQNSPL